MKTVFVLGWPAFFLVISAAMGWETFHGSGALTGHVQAAPSGTVQQLWRTSVDGPVSFTCLISDQGIYVFNDRGAVTALDHRGNRLWQNGLPGNARWANTGVLLADGLAAATTRGEIFFYNPKSGRLLWKKSLGIEVMAPLNKALIGKQEHVLVMDQEKGVLHALSGDTGETTWQTTGVGRSDCPAAVSGASAVFGSCLARVHLVDVNQGRESGSVELGSESQVAAGAALEDGIAYVGDRSGTFSAVNLTDKTLLWEISTGEDALFTTPALSAQLAVVGSESGELVAVKKTDGTVAWRRALSLGPTSPAVCGSSILTTDDGKLHMLDASEGRRIGEWPVSDAVSPVAVFKHLAVIGTDEGEVIAFGIAGPPATP